MEKKREAVHDTTMSENLYFHNSSCTIFILDQKEMGKGERCRQGLEALREVFLPFFFSFLELVNMFVLHGRLIVGLN